MTGFPSSAPGDNWQIAPFPHALGALVGRIRHPNLRFTLEHLDRGHGSSGLTLTIETVTPNTYDPADPETGIPRNEPILIAHTFPVPPWEWDGETWRIWVFDRILDFLAHEAAEGFEERIIGNVWSKPFAPRHSGDSNPYFRY